MSTQSQPASASQGKYHAVGGALVVPSQPDESCYPLRMDQFETMCDGEMSTARSSRDVCFGILATGCAAITGLYFTIDWDSTISHGRKGPIVVISLLSIATASALVIAIAEMVRMRQTRGHSGYARLIRTISEYFHISHSS